MSGHPADWHQLAPGAYSDDAGTLHLVIPEMLEGAGYADTPANRALLEKAARGLAVEGTTVEVAE